MEKYRHIYRVFNDDIQGTGCVALSGLMSAARNSGSSLAEMRILCAGAGTVMMCLDPGWLYCFVLFISRCDYLIGIVYDYQQR